MNRQRRFRVDYRPRTVVSAAIELHDSELAAIIREGDTVILRFTPAYVHRAGSGWLQNATFVFAGAVVSTTVTLPCEVSDRWLRINAIRHENLVPAEGAFTGHCELWLALVNTEFVSIHGTVLTVSLHDQPHYLEKIP